MMKLQLLILTHILFALTGNAQDNITYAELNRERLETNKTGMLVLGGWGAANLAYGTIGYASASEVVWKSFHGMNAVWGAVNGLIAVGGYYGAIKECRKKYDEYEAFRRYQTSKRVYLINVGLDVLYIGGGIAIGTAINDTKKPGLWLGIGRSVALQGIALLLFDCAMYGVHQSDNKKWAKIAGGLTMTGNSIGYTYRF